MDNILVIRLSSLGDVLLTTPLLRGLKRRYPSAKIDFLTKPAFASLLENHPALHRVIRFGENAGHGLKSMRHRALKDYDLVVDLHRNLRSYLMTAGFGRPRVVRYPKWTFRRRLLTRLKWNLLAGAPPVPERYLLAVRALGVEDDGQGLDFYMSPAAATEADRLFHEHGLESGKPIALAPGARWKSKRWPAEKFVELIRRFPEEKFLLLGDVEERAAAASIAGQCANAVVNLAGKTDLPTAGELLKRCRALVTNDSGLMHVGSAAGTPLVALFGSTVKEFGFFPFRARAKVLETPLPCRPCTVFGRNDCPRKGSFECLNSISAERVAGALDDVLKT